MARKLFLIIALFLLVGEVMGRMADEDVKYLSEVYNIPAEEMQDVNVPAREKRFFGGLFKMGISLGKKIFNKIRDKIRNRHRG